MTAVDFTDTGVIVNKHFLKATYSPFKFRAAQLVSNFFCQSKYFCRLLKNSQGINIIDLKDTLILYQY